MTYRIDIWKGASRDQSLGWNANTILYGAGLKPLRLGGPQYPALWGREKGPLMESTLDGILRNPHLLLCQVQFLARFLRYKSDPIKASRCVDGFSTAHVCTKIFHVHEIPTSVKFS